MKSSKMFSKRTYFFVKTTYWYKKETSASTQIERNGYDSNTTVPNM